MSNQVFADDVLRLIGVLPEGQTSDATDGGLVLRLANEMVDEWGEDGLAIAWTPDPELTDDCALQGLELNAVKYATALRACVHYGKAATQDMVVIAANAYNKLIRIQINRSLEPSEPILPSSEASWRRYDITRDQ